MAKKSFLTDSLWLEYGKQLAAIGRAVGKGEAGYQTPQLSRWLSEVLLQRLSANPLWLAAEPIALGSWARDELTPQSDIDLLFAGEESAAGELMRGWQAAGLRVRGRVPEAREDWTQGVEPFDVLAILHGRSFSPRGQQLLEEQQRKIVSLGTSFKRRLLVAMLRERQVRSQRYGSITNYLEPHLKFGPGGLRDLQQGLYVFELFPERFAEAQRALEQLRQVRDFLLLVRRKVQADGAGDVLSASEQRAMAEWLGFKDSIAFMRRLQKGMSQVSFYGDWAVAQARLTRQQLNYYRSLRVENLLSGYQQLAKDPSLAMQKIIRDLVETAPRRDSSALSLGRALQQTFAERVEERQVTALFRSGLIEAALPGFKHLLGRVQHDQYHRYTADAHVQQCLRQAAKIHRRPRLLGQLEKLARSLDEEDWRILYWSCLYHDLGKGRRGDHAQVGARMVVRDFVNFGLPGNLQREVQWMVLHHLALSEAAFRKNPRSPTTWQELLDIGVSGQRLVRLAVFTAIDILGTNPEAWSSWKERLLKDLVDVMASSPALSFADLLASLRREHNRVNWEFVHQLDPAIIVGVSKRILARDYRGLKHLGRKKNLSLEPLVWLDRKHRLWIRLHVHQDQPGVFAQLVGTLYRLGLRIHYAAAQTYDEWGVYDWFQVASKKRPQWIREQLARAMASDPEPISLPDVKFARIFVVSESEQEAVISFRGKDSPGALAVAAHALSQQGFDILWGRAHTWGRQIDDSFGVRPLADVGFRLEKICALYLQK